MDIHKVLLGTTLSYLLMLTPALAQESDEDSIINNDPFEVSDVICKKNPSLGCVKVSPDSSATVGDIIRIFNKKGFSITLAHVRILNGWGEEITENTLIKSNKEFALTN
jgi:hypothetical protein